MASPDTVLVLTERLDPTADLVVAELARRGVAVVRFDTAEFPADLRVCATFDGRWHGVVHTRTHVLHLDALCGAYYRRPSAFVFPPGMTEHELGWANLEARIGLGGVLATVPHWLNHPSRIGFAEYKPIQLAAAAAAGLDTPRTLITNDPADARRFAAGVGQVVYKPFSAATEKDGRRAFVYTTPVTADDIDDAVRLTAHLFQEWVPKAHEVRLTVVDDQLFAARLTAGSEAARVDWRSDYPSLVYAVDEVPAEVRLAVLRLLAELGLRFAAMDFVVTPAGRWVFLDLNPNGQWAWIEHETGLPLCAAIADALTRDPPPR
ncbi:MAG TPA: ATP-grasp ribosomal peptide maturase [Cryptosporangiaceae bacterium]|nr:ATP-grasp ribosomal peptide maturase [Cryptosporangiaceae bacterium]